MVFKKKEKSVILCFQENMQLDSFYVAKHTKKKKCIFIGTWILINHINRC